jgi:anti-anti-sigma regulatory factor
MAEGIVIELDGKLDIQRALELKEKLFGAHQAEGGVTIDFGRVTGADVSGLQLLCSLHGTLSVENRQMTLCGAMPEGLKQAVRESGYARERGCVKDRNRTCLWVLGGGS